MQILVYIDQEDKDACNHLIDVCATEPASCMAVKAQFWHSMIDKYPVLKNRPLAINLVDGFIFHVDTYADNKWIKLGRLDVLHP